MSDLALNRGLTSNKLTHYLLDYGNFKGLSQTFDDSTRNKIKKLFALLLK